MTREMNIDSEKKSLTKLQNTSNNDRDCFKTETCWKCILCTCIMIIVVPITVFSIYGIEYTYSENEECLNSSGNTEEDCKGEWQEWLIFISCIICLLALWCRIFKYILIALIDNYCCDKRINESSIEYGQV